MAPRRAYGDRPLADGSHPFAHRLNIDRSIGADEILPDDTTVERRVTSLQQVFTLASARRCRILVITYPTSTTLEVAAETEPVAARVASQIRHWVSVDPPAKSTESADDD
jgi:hypothetical protein